MGHVVSKNGIKPNPKLIESVEKWKVPKNVKDVQQFLGLCNYYRQFVSKFSEIASPLSKLTRKDVIFKWSDECQYSFEMLKKALCKAPVLAYPNPHGNFVLDTDASNVGIGAVLSQVQDGKEKVIAYGSKKLDKQQQRYSVTRRELLAVVTFIHQFRHYLVGKKFLLRTDHGSLRWLFAFKDPQGQLARWLESLSQYSFDIQHRPGEKHKNADSLSRRDSENSVCEHQKNGLDSPDCLDCQSMLDEWSDFKKSVDTVENLGQGSVDIIRVVTRSHNKKFNQSNWLDGYSNKEIESFQREDNGLKLVHEWFDCNITPCRDEAASFSPALRKYWLNFNLLERKVVFYIKSIFPVIQLISDISFLFRKF